MGITNATLGALNAVSPEFSVSDNNFDISIYGTFVGTVSIQRKYAGEADSEYRTVEAVTAPAERYGEVAGNWVYRAIMTAYTSGSAKIKFVN